MRLVHHSNKFCNINGIFHFHNFSHYTANFHNYKGPLSNLQNSDHPDCKLFTWNSVASFKKYEEFCFNFDISTDVFLFGSVSSVWNSKAS